MTDYKKIKQWCSENDYLLIDLRKERIPTQAIITIAERATGIDDIFKKTRKQEYSFARHLATAYLDKHLSAGIISELFGFNHTVPSYVRNQDFMNCDVKFYKHWQQKAILYFREKIDEIEKNLQTNDIQI